MLDTTHLFFFGVSRFLTFPMISRRCERVLGEVGGMDTLPLMLSTYMERIDDIFVAVDLTLDTERLLRVDMERRIHEGPGSLSSSDEDHLLRSTRPGVVMEYCVSLYAFA